MFVLINPLFHPYAGMIRIRLEGIISACDRRHPLKSIAGAKVRIFRRTAKSFEVFLCQSENNAYLCIHIVNLAIRYETNSGYWWSRLYWFSSL